MSTVGNECHDILQHRRLEVNEKKTGSEYDGKVHVSIVIIFAGIRCDFESMDCF